MYKLSHSPAFRHSLTQQSTVPEVLGTAPSGRSSSDDPPLVWRSEGRKQWVSFRRQKYVYFLVHVIELPNPHTQTDPTREIARVWRLSGAAWASQKKSATAHRFAVPEVRPRQNIETIADAGQWLQSLEYRVQGDESRRCSARWGGWGGWGGWGDGGATAS